MNEKQRERWYLDHMAPNTKGERFAWLDPSSLYINAKTFHALLDDLHAPFAGDDIDVVGGMDAMGFVLGSALAVRLGCGFIAFRKANKIPLDSDQVTFTNYSGRTQEMELRKPAFHPRTRVLLVDQWVETGGTMNAGIELVERQQGIVAGIAAVCIEDNDATRVMRERYKCATAVVPGSAIQSQCDRQALESFAHYEPEQSFP